MRALAAAALSALALAPAALADGDPASDYLIGLPAFLPFDAKIDKSRGEQFSQLLAEAKQQGFEIRVAIIATKYDLGAVPVLYRHPQQYARFLGQELFYWYKHELLVVMPNGYGVYRHGPAPAGDLAALAKLAPPNSTSGNALVAAAGRAVRVLAKRHGIVLAEVKPAASHSSTNRDRLEIALAIVILGALAWAALFVRRRSRR
jgi:hypothetical protein